MKKLSLIVMVGFCVVGCKKLESKSEIIDSSDKNAQVQNVTYSPNNPLLKAANDDVMIGAAINEGKFNNSLYTNLAGSQYNSITAENEMKFAQTEKTRGYFTYDGDQVVLFAQNHGIHRVHGHNLIWYTSNPGWLANATTAGMNNDQTYRSIMNNHIRNLIFHYATFKNPDGSFRIQSWDVVNEAMDDNGNLRSCIWTQKIAGEAYTYIKLAFQYARQAAIDAGQPDLKLFYNDFGHEYSKTKSDAIANLVNRLQNEPTIGGRKIIDGVGLQMHTSYTRQVFENGNGLANVEYGIQTMKNTGLKVHISELDIRGDNTNINSSAAIGGQNYRYFNIPQLYRKIVPVNQRWGITLWNIGDGDSSQGANNTATLYDTNYNKKSMYQQFYEGLNQGLQI